MPSRTSLPLRALLTFSALALATLTAACTARPPRPMAYVANNMHGTVSAVDLAERKVVADVELPRRGPRMPFPAFVAATADGTKVYVANLNGESIGIIDTARNRLLGVIALDHAPRGIALTPDGQTLLVTNDGDEVLRIDTGADEVRGRIAAGGPTVGVAVSPDGRRAYFSTAGALLVADVASDTVVARLEDVHANSAVVVSRDGRTVYALVNRNPIGAVYVIDADSHAVKAIVTVDSSPVAAAASPDGRWLYVVNRGSNTVAAIDLAINEVVAHVSVGEVPAGVAAAPDGSAVYVTGSRGNILTVVGTPEHAVEGTIALNPPEGARPLGVVIVTVP